VLAWLATKRAVLLIIAPGKAGECIGDIVNPNANPTDANHTLAR